MDLKNLELNHVCVANVMTVIAAKFSFLKFNQFNQFFSIF